MKIKIHSGHEPGKGIHMKNEINEILSEYTTGGITLEKANAELAAAGSSTYLDPEKNVLTKDEIEETVVRESPAEACGTGLLDIGTGCLDKVFVADGKLPAADCGEMPHRLWPCGGCSGPCGIVYRPADFPATDPLTAVSVGIVSGLAATGINQITKQIAKE